MQPALHRGDLVIGQRYFEPQVQDIVFVQVSTCPLAKQKYDFEKKPCATHSLKLPISDQVICHRIVSKKGQLFETKGDANKVTDNWLYKTKSGFTRRDMIGKLSWHIPTVGMPILLIRETLLAKVSKGNHNRLTNNILLKKKSSVKGRFCLDMDDGAMLVYKILNTDTWLMIKDSVESFIIEDCFVATLIEIIMAENNFGMIAGSF